MKTRAWRALVACYHSTLLPPAPGFEKRVPPPLPDADDAREDPVRQLAPAVRMEIVDNGRAFSVSNPVNGGDRQPQGLLGMQECVRLVNAAFAIESVPRRGTTVRIEIPLPNHRHPNTGSLTGLQLSSPTELLAIPPRFL